MFLTVTYIFPSNFTRLGLYHTFQGGKSIICIWASSVFMCLAYYM